MAAGEEGTLRQRLRQMEARQSSVQRCSVVATTQASLQEGLRAVQTQLNAILAEEQAQTDALAGTIPKAALQHALHQAAGLDKHPLYMHCRRRSANSKVSLPGTAVAKKKAGSRKPLVCSQSLVLQRTRLRRM